MSNEIKSQRGQNALQSECSGEPSCSPQDWAFHLLKWDKSTENVEPLIKAKERGCPDPFLIEFVRLKLNDLVAERFVSLPKEIAMIKLKDQTDMEYVEMHNFYMSIWVEDQLEQIAVLLGVHEKTDAFEKQTGDE